MKLEFTLNGKTTRIEAAPERSLMQVVREDLGLTGTKCGCDTGDCGVCMVIVDGKLVKSCLVKAGDLAGRTVTTIEGLHDASGGPNDLQQSFLRHGATQCGYCIPSMVLAGEALLQRNPCPTRAEIRAGIETVLCRCTGYQQIVDAIEETAGQRSRQIAESVR